MLNEACSVFLQPYVLNLIPHFRAVLNGTGKGTLNGLVQFVHSKKTSLSMSAEALVSMESEVFLEQTDYSFGHLRPTDDTVDSHWS